MANNLEIERKFLINALPENLSDFPQSKICQAYLLAFPTVRIRKNDEKYELTYKGPGGLTHPEYNLPLTEEGYLHLLEKADGKVIEKTRYKIPFGKFLIELDIFEGHMKGLIMAEVEFDSEEEALAFDRPCWFGMDVTDDKRYKNAYMALQAESYERDYK